MLFQSLPNNRRPVLDTHRQTANQLERPDDSASIGSIGSDTAASVIIRLVAGLLLGWAAGGLLLRPAPLIELGIARWIETSASLLAQGIRIDALSLLAIAFVAAALSSSTRASVVDLLCLLLVVMISVAGDVMMATLAWVALLFGVHRAGSASGARHISLLIGYVGGISLIGAALLAMAGGSSMLWPHAVGAAGAMPYLLVLLAVATAFPMLVANDPTRGGSASTMLAIGGATLLIRTSLAWVSGPLSEMQIGAATLLVLVGVIASSRAAGVSSASVWSRQLLLELSLVGAAGAIGGPVGIAAAVTLLVGVGLSALPIVGGFSRQSPDGGRHLAHVAMAGLAPLPAFAGRGILLTTFVANGQWVLVGALFVASVASVRMLGRLALASRVQPDTGAAKPNGVSSPRTVLLSLPLILAGLVPGLVGAVVALVTELSTNSQPPAVGVLGDTSWVAVAILFLSWILGAAWCGEETRRTERRARAERLRGAAAQRERSRGIGLGVAHREDRHPTAIARFAVAAGRQLAGAAPVALLLEAAILIGGMVLVALRSGRI